MVRRFAPSILVLALCVPAVCETAELELTLAPVKVVEKPGPGWTPPEPVRVLAPHRPRRAAPGGLRGVRRMAHP